MTATTEEVTAVEARMRQRVRGLFAELEDVRRDTAMAARCNTLPTRSWLARLACGQRDCWWGFVEALAAGARSVGVRR